MLIFGKKVETRLTAEKHIKNIKVIVPSLSFPLSRLGKRNLRKIMNKIKYATAGTPRFMADVSFSENAREPTNPRGKEIKNAMEKKSAILPIGSGSFFLAKNRIKVPAPSTPPKRDKPGKYGKTKKTNTLAKMPFE